jgi:hypothetical protein
VIGPLGCFFLWGKDLRNVETSLLCPPTIVDPSGSIFSNATVQSLLVQALRDVAAMLNAHVHAAVLAHA